MNAMMAERTGLVYLLREVGTGRRKVACEKSCLNFGLHQEIIWNGVASRFTFSVVRWSKETRRKAHLNVDD